MLHPDARLIDALGRDKIKAHFQCSDAIISRWRRKGLSKLVRKPFMLLCSLHGVA